ncbi:MAG: PAS domain-containing protein, partial [Clostridiales bacterium]|nr:PAS domain-containing protein [Clostridiales bacterium]
MGLEYVYLFDILDEGLIVVDEKQKIQFINNRAKDIFGLRNKYILPHGSGKIEEGDIVIIGDTSFGDDDGGLDSKDLKVLGLHNNVNKGDYFLYIGKFGKGGEFSSGKVLSASYKLEKNIEENNLKVEIDYNQKKVVIIVNEKFMELEFIKSVGHIVVLDKNFNIKFYQAKGYTVRGETIKELLNDNSFY